MPNLHTRYVVPPHVVSREVDGDLVLLDMKSGEYFGLDPIGARIWMCIIEENLSLEATRDALLAEFDVNANALGDDILKLVEEMADQDLIFLID